MGNVWNCDVTVCCWKLESREGVCQHLLLEFLYLPSQYSSRASDTLNLPTIYHLVVKIMNASGPNIGTITII